MGLSQDEQRALDAIEEQLRKQDPLLAFRLAGFRPYLTPPERRRWLRWVVAVAALIAVLSLAALAVLAALGALGGHGGRRHAPPATPSSAQVSWHQPGQDGG
jgi:hypothetical protein